MKAAKTQSNEKERLESLLALNILDTLPEKNFDQIVELASTICNTPIALISLVGEDRQWFKAKVGLSASETTREVSFCSHAILESEVLVVSDSTKDARFQDNPLVTGSPNVLFYAGAPLLSPNGHPIGTVCVIDSKPRTLTPEQLSALKALSSQVTNLLELRTKIQSLEKSEAALAVKRTAVENIVEGIVVQDLGSRIVDFNPAALKVLGLTADQLTGKTSMDPDWKAIHEDGSDFPGDDHPAMICLRTGKKQFGRVMGISTPSGATRWLRINSVPLLSPTDGKPNFAVTSFVDITLELDSKRKIEKKRNDLRFFLDSIPYIIGYWSSDLINLNCNSNYAAMYGKTPDEIRGRHLSEIIGQDNFQKNLENISAVLGGKTIQFERRITTEVGSPTFSLTTYVPNKIKDHVNGFLILIADITTIKCLEGDRRKLELQLSEASRLSSLGEMAAGVAHEINNPLAIIRGKTSILKRRLEENTLSSSVHLKDFTTIEITVDRIAKIIKGLRNCSRNSENDPFETVALATIIEDTMELCRERFRLAQVDVRISCDPKLNIQCRPAQISQILTNLLANSFDAISCLQEKWIEINALDNPDRLSILVRDSGTGIDSLIAKKIMDPFYTTKPVGKGTGLGLSISLGLAEGHGGSLKHVPTEKNTTFVLSLPKTQNSKPGQVA